MAKYKLERLLEINASKDSNGLWALPEGTLRFDGHPGRADYIKQYNDICRTIIACKMAECEAVRLNAYSQVRGNADISDDGSWLALNGYNEDIYKIFFFDKPYDDILAQNMHHYYEQLYKLGCINALIDFNSNTEAKLSLGLPGEKLFETYIKDGDTSPTVGINDMDALKNHAQYMQNICDMDALDFGKYFENTPQDTVIRDLSEDTLKTLTQAHGKTRENSKLYTELSDAIKDIGNANAKVDGVRDADYFNIFNKAEKYLSNHETRLSGENGQARVTACFEVFAKTGFKLLEDPMNSDVDLKMKVQMLRDSKFRSVAVDIASENIKKVMQGSVDALTYMNLSKTDRAKVDIAIGTIAFCKKADELLKQNKNPDRIKGKLPGGVSLFAAQNALYEKYKEAFTYSKDFVAHHLMSPNVKKSDNAIKESESALADKKARLDSFELKRDAYRIAAKNAAADNDDAAVLNCCTELLYMAVVSEQQDFVSATEFNKYFDPDTRKANVEALRPFAAKMLTDMSEKAYQSLMKNGKSEDLTPEVMIKQLKNMAKNSDKIKKEYNSNLEKNDGKFKRKDDAPQIQKNM